MSNLIFSEKKKTKKKKNKKIKKWRMSAAANLIGVIGVKKKDDGRKIKISLPQKQE